MSAGDPADSVPTPVDDDVTIPVDAEEMLAAAKRSAAVPDASEAPARNVVRRATVTSGAPQGPHARLQVAGSGASIMLRIYNVSATGAAFEIPEGHELRVQEGVNVMVEVFFERTDSTPSARLLAEVVHMRPARPGRLGGVSIRWDRSRQDNAGDVDRLLERLEVTPSPVSSR